MTRRKTVVDKTNQIKNSLHWAISENIFMLACPLFLAAGRNFGSGSVCGVFVYGLTFHCLLDTQW